MGHVCAKLTYLKISLCMTKLSNFFFCHYVFKKLSAAEASESVYMRERVKLSFMEIFQVFVTMFSKSSAADELYVG